MTASNSTEYFEYRIPSKFIGEIQIVLATIVLISGIITVTSFSEDLQKAEGAEKEIAIGFITYSTVVILVALTDIFFASLLISATNKISLQRCLIWKSAALTTLILLGFLTFTFIILLQTPSLILGFLPTLMFKPFGIWIVKGFINELGQLVNLPCSNDLPSSATRGKVLKRTTRIYINKKKTFSPTHQNGRINNGRRKSETSLRGFNLIGSKISPIPEENKS